MELSKKLLVTSAKKMRDLGATIAKNLPKNVHLVLLEGPLGAGKTTFAQGFASYLKIKPELTSPTFTLINSFSIPKKKTTLHHIDLYRIALAKELVPLGIHQLLNEKNSLVLIEWSNKHPQIFKNLPRLRVRITIRNAKRLVRTQLFDA